MKFIPKFLAFSFFTLLLSSCGGERPMVKNLKIDTTQEATGDYIKLNSELSIGNINLSDISIPIYHPKSGEELGELEVYRDLVNNKNHVALRLNISGLLGFRKVTEYLPNGKRLPLIGENPVISIPVGNIAKVYLALSSDISALGLSLNIKGLDPVGEKVGTTSIFPSFNSNNTNSV